MVRLEEGEHGDASAAREWFDRVVSAPSDPSYFCGSCSVESAEWHSLCPKCGSFDMLTWRSGAAASTGVERGALQVLRLPKGA
jgi:HemY protein